ncbi:hypothetical protein B0J18DRAFT_86617 [Chaetomium sp. MPI-SDFR-AT-0129]|nr:hypothetical protein B0J18DRAFT_86617 [Chaetomium sp. MPI-SDFR-AT-0129]
MLRSSEPLPLRRRHNERTKKDHAPWHGFGVDDVGVSIFPSSVLSLAVEIFQNFQDDCDLGKTIRKILGPKRATQPSNGSEVRDLANLPRRPLIGVPGMTCHSSSRQPTPTPTSPECQNPNQGGTVRKQMEVSARQNSLASQGGRWPARPPRQANLGYKCLSRNRGNRNRRLHRSPSASSGLCVFATAFFLWGSFKDEDEVESNSKWLAILRGKEAALPEWCHVLVTRVHHVARVPSVCAECLTSTPDDHRNGCG